MDAGKAGRKAPKDTDLQAFVRLVKEHLKPHLWRIGFSILAMAVIAATTVASAWLIQPAVDKMFNQQDKTLLWMIPAAIVIVFAIKAVAITIQGVLVAYIGNRIVADLQIKLFNQVINSDLGRLTSTHSGRFTSSLINDTRQLRRAVAEGIVGFFRNGLTAFGLIVFVYFQHLMLAFIATVVLPLILLVVRRLGKRTRKATKQGMAETGNMSMLMSESLDGIRIVKAYGQERREIDRMTGSIERRMNHALKAAYARAMAAPVTEGITGIGLAGVILYGGYEGMEGRITLGQFMSILVAILSAYQPLRALATVQTVLAEGMAAASRVYSVMDVKPEVIDAPDAPPLKVQKARIDFENVSFGYQDGKSALENLTLKAEQGKTIALVGPSGAGKSTVLNLIPRFYDVSTGTVRIDGTDVRTVSLSSLRRSISIVTQTPFLFDETIRANIAYSRPGASEEDIIAAAKGAAAHDFIMELHDGYDTLVGEQGVRLSGGQRQRIAIARAFLADTPILLLDEATSALDTESERQVQKALGSLMKGRTTIVIAHRLSTVIDADTIYVMDQGRVRECGTHTELLAKGGLYTKLYSTQFSEDGAPSAGG